MSYTTPRNKENGMSHEDAVVYEKRIMELDTLIIIWPPAREEYAARQKNHLIRHLDDIAMHFTVTARPQTFVLNQSPRMPISPRNGKMYIMKREVSDSGRHFKGPTAVSLLTRSEVEDMRRPELPWRWLVQDYVPYLRTVGEWRLVLLNGKVHHACATTPVDNPLGADITRHCPVAQQWSLREMR